MAADLSTTTQVRLGEVLVPKGFEFDRGVSGPERENVLGRILLLPAWVDNQLDAANLDVRHLEGWAGFYRLRVGDVRAVFQRLERDVVIHRVARRSDVYDGLDALALVRSGDGLRVLSPRAAPEPALETERRPRITRPAHLPVVQNPLSPFSDQHLLEAGLSPEGLDVVRRLPPGLLPEDALGRLEVEPRMIRLVAELWEQPAEYLKLLDEGAKLDDELVRLEE